jgi:ribonuclease HII
MGSDSAPPIRPTHPVTAATAKQRMLKLLICSDAPEQALRHRGFRLIAGVDEVGRGALFGPVVAAAVILPERLGGLARAGLKDSKQLTREQRERLDRRIRKCALALSVAEVDAETIDRVNIYQATRIAMLAAVQGLALTPDHLLIDAMRLDHPCPQTRLFYGDALSLSIAAASVIAKVHRDRLMRELDAQHPGYGLASHKGYGTPEHRRSLRELGPCVLHRRTFAPVRALITGEPEVSGLLFDELLPGDPLLEDMLMDNEELEAGAD